MNDINLDKYLKKKVNQKVNEKGKNLPAHAQNGVRTDRTRRVVYMPRRAGRRRAEKQM